MDIFASKLRERAAALGISNAEAARRAGLNERRYAHYVSGLREPDLATLVRIASALGTTPNMLLGVEDPTMLDARGALLDRLSTALNVIPVTTLAVLATQIEALADDPARENP